MKIKIIYETQVGTTKRVAELIQKKLIEKNHAVDLHSVLKNGLKPILEGYDIVLFGSPTYYNGQLEVNMGQLVEKFSPDLSNVKVAVFCLGDSNYEHFCGAAEILEAWIISHGGKVAVPTLKIDGYTFNDVLVGEWVDKILS